MCTGMVIGVMSSDSVLSEDAGISAVMLLFGGFFGFVIGRFME